MTHESQSPRNWQAEVRQNSRKASAFIETGDKRGSIKSPCENYETSEFLNFKPTKLDLTGDAVEATKENEAMVIQELSTF